MRELPLVICVFYELYWYGWERPSCVLTETVHSVQHHTGNLL